MAPVDRVDHNALERKYPDSLKTLSQSLRALHTSAAPPNQLPSVPPELLEYVENGRNPDIYTREFVELVRHGNQLMRGKLNAFSTFRDVLAENMTSAMPELRDDVAQVVEATGGVPPGRRSGEQNGASSSSAAAGSDAPHTGTAG
ncbi:hypothetical protein FDECE_16527 [Fusarium decemcellulare]|nr:hypothetical protein FDECE_16527 [Fusarium decemcellulare]